MEREEAITIFMEASRMMQEMKLKQALDSFELVKPTLPEIPSLYYNIALIQSRLGNYELAEVEIFHALKLDEANLKYQKFYFNILQKSGQFKLALEKATEILEFEYDPEIKLNQAFLLLRIDEIEKSVTILRELLKEGAHYGVIYFTLGVLLNQGQEYQEAEKLMKEAIKQNYQKDDATSILINILENQNKNNEAIDILERQMTKTVNDEFSLAKLYKNENKIDEALNIIDQLLANEEKNIDYLNFKGHTLRESGMYSNSIEMYDQVFEIDNDNLSAIKGKALALVELGQHEEANTLFEKGERLNRGDQLPNFDDLVMNLDVIE